MTIQEMHQSNRAAWNEAAAHYAEELDADVAMLRGAGTNFEPPEYPYLNELGEWCGRAIHLQCAGGRDTLSLWNLGAKEVVGIDISEDMISVARRKSEALNAPASWFCCDLLETPPELDGTADLVYTGRGALNWLHDTNGWAAVVSRLLVPGGRFYVFDSHPLTWVWDQSASELRLDPEDGDYFQTTSYVGQGWGPSYVGELSKPEAELSKKYESQKTFAQILDPLLKAGLRLEKLEEHPNTFWDQFPHLPREVVAKLPNTFSLLMRKD